MELMLLQMCGVEHSSEQRDSKSSGKILKAFFSFIYFLFVGEKNFFAVLFSGILMMITEKKNE
jgi:hypothetical protein